ncbi:hypothetical protein AC1031_011912 [Aphanomyces cochlioides]|nr:hypothetical protein AC1031_011912 [Aphanomyces cochlioides]
MRTFSQQEPLVGGSSRPVVLGRDSSPGSLSNRSIDHFASSTVGMHHSNDRIAREYAQTPRPPPFRLGMTRLAQHDDEVFNSWRNKDEFSAAEFFLVPPILPDPARRPDFAKVARLANQLKRGISDSLPFPDLVIVALDLLFTFRSMVMSQVQWQDYREALRRRDEEASQGRRGPTTTQPSQSHPTCAPVNPMVDETAVDELTSLETSTTRSRTSWLLQIGAFVVHASIIPLSPTLCDGAPSAPTGTLSQPVVVGIDPTATSSLQIFRLRVVLIGVRPRQSILLDAALRRVILNRSLPCAIDTSRRIISVTARQADALVRVLSLVDGIPKRVVLVLVLVLVDGILKRVVLVLVLVDGILKRVVPVPVRLQDGKVQILGLLRGVTDLKSARCRNATRPVPSPRQRRLNNRNSRIFTPSKCPSCKASRRTRRVLTTP